MPARRTDAGPSGNGAARELRARGLATRERLLDAGATVFAARGVHAARVDDIVKVAATSHGTFYLYFANKEELFHALAEQVAGELEALAGRLPALTPDAVGIAALDAWMREFGELYARTGPVIRAWTETEMVATAMGRLGTVVWAAFTTALVERIRSTGVEGIDPVVAALAIVAMIERANYYVLTGQVPAPDGTLPATLARVTHGAIFGNG
jgi:AcrR family transcriptional regulator